jgi:uncharacterized membrane protein YbaN (DUF454 family)
VAADRAAAGVLNAVLNDAGGRRISSVHRMAQLSSALVRLLWRALAAAALLLGLVGIVVPGLPTVPFLLVAAWAGGKGWPALEAWLLAHPRYGPTIRRWREHGAIPRSAKWAASGTMLLSAGILWLTTLPLAARIGIPLLMLAVAVWMWRRPEA